MKAVITAGGRIGVPYASEAGTAIKALARVRGKTMLDRIIDALRDAGVTRIAVVGGAEVSEACGRRVERIVDESPSGAQNVLRALRAWPDDDWPLLYATSDMPYVTADAVDDFVRRVPGGAIAMAVSEHAHFVARFPEAPPSGIELARERIVNGGLFSLPCESCSDVAALATRLFDARKAPWRMATLISLGAILRFAFGRLSVAAVEREAHRIVRRPAAAVRGCAPELAFDADTVVDYRYACKNA